MSPSGLIRRRAVLASSASLVTGLAGCSTIFNQSSDSETYHPPPLYQIVLWNHYDTEIRVTLVAKRNGKIVHWDTHTVRQPDDGSRAYGFSLTDKEWMGCSQYDVSARLQDESKWAALDFRELEPAGVRNGKAQSIELNFDFLPDGLNLRPTYLDDPLIRCEENTTGT